MESFGLGGGLAALAFWGFVAAVSVGGIWDGIRKREAEHETVRRLIESGQPIDQELLKKLSLVGDDGQKRPDRMFFLAGLWILPVAVGLGLFGLILGASTPKVVAPLLGVSALLVCVGLGFLAASKVVKRWYPAEGDSAE